MTFIPAASFTVPMVGEGLGHGTTEEEREQLAKRLFNTNNGNGGVVSIGEFIIDRVIDLDEPQVAQYVDDWEREDWFPAPGESVCVDDMPAYVRDHAVEQLPGGRGANQAVAAAMSGAETTYVGRVGEDRSTLASLKSHGVSLDYVDQTFDQPTSEAYIFQEESGENRITCYKPDGGLLDEDYLEPFLSADTADSVLGAEYVLLTNGESDNVIHDTLSRIDAAEDGPSVIFDPAPADGAEDFLDYDCVDIVTPNAVEYEELQDDLDGYEGTVVKTSSDGATINSCYNVDAPNVDTVDTTGAGDTFNGYLAGQLADGTSLEESTTYAVHAASLSVTRDGAQAGIPSMEEVDAFLQGVKAE